MLTREESGAGDGVEVAIGVDRVLDAVGSSLYITNGVSSTVGLEDILVACIRLGTGGFGLPVGFRVRLMVVVEVVLLRDAASVAATAGAFCNNSIYSSISTHFLACNTAGLAEMVVIKDVSLRSTASAVVWGVCNPFIYSAWLLVCDKNAYMFFIAETVSDERSDWEGSVVRLDMFAYTREVRFPTERGAWFSMSRSSMKEEKQSVWTAKQL